MRNRRRDALVAQTVRGHLGHAMRAGCYTADALDYLAKSFVQLMKVRRGDDFVYVRNCLWWANDAADKAMAEIAAAGKP